jgi:sortase A
MIKISVKSGLRRRGMKRKLTTIAIIVLMLSGLSLLLYPLVANIWNNYRQKTLINAYNDTVNEKVKNGEIDYEEEMERAVTYNEELLPSILPDSFAQAEAAEVEDESYMACLNLAGDGIMGYVEIPEIGIKIPIFHTTNDDVLEIGAGHLEGSSLPVGGESTHAVIAAHRGLPSASLFTDLDKLEIGDCFFIMVLDQTLAYEVDQILVVEPDETDSLAVVEGEDLVTLLTCTPYGVNTQRLLVRGHRVEYTPELLEDSKNPLAAYSLHTNYLFWVIVGLAVTALFILILYFLDKKMTKKETEKPD